MNQFVVQGVIFTIGSTYKTKIILADDSLLTIENPLRAMIKTTFKTIWQNNRVFNHNK